MPNRSDPSFPTRDDDVSLSHDGDRVAAASNTRSILGLGLVSVLNIGCVAFIAYHFASHREEPVYAQALELRPGNISLEPASTQLLAVASSIEQTSPAEEIAERLIDLPMPFEASPLPISPQPEQEAMAAAEPDNVSTESGESAETQHWVQLGALSRMATARSYWSKLQDNHDVLLGTYQPAFFGPDQVGGSLYHIRVGPLGESTARALCLDLQQANTDCFCLTAEGEVIDHGKPQYGNVISKSSY